MKTARFLLACVAASLLAACGSDTITAPATPTTPARPHFDEDVGPGGGPGGGDAITTYGSDPTNCMLVYVVKADGSLAMQCQVTATSQMGSGG